MSFEQPKYAPGDHVKIRNDEGKWDEAWIVNIVPTYQYTIRCKPHREYKGQPIVGVYKDGKDIRPFDDSITSPERTCETCDVDLALKQELGAGCHDEWNKTYRRQGDDNRIYR